MTVDQEPARTVGRFQGMMRPVWRFSARLAALYVLVELAALALLTWAFGLGWTLLVLFVTFLAGMVLAGSQLRGQRAALRRAGTDPRSAITEGVLVGLGAFLVFIPGLVTTAAGALMLAPPTRGAMRPVADTLLTRGIDRRLAAANLSAFSGRGTGRGYYVDGQVVDGQVIDGQVIDGPDLPAPR